MQQETVFVMTSFFPPDGYERQQIRFDAPVIESGGASALGLRFRTTSPLLTGQSFTASEDACTWFPSMGSCWSMGYFGSYEGDFRRHHADDDWYGL